MTGLCGNPSDGGRYLSACAAGAVLAGPLLAVSVGLLGSALRTPEINLPFEEMLGSPATKVLLGILVVILGPVAEELAFRGFLMPLLIRSLGPAGGHHAHGRHLWKHPWL